MSDAKKPEPDEDLLEFLGGIDEANEEAQDGDFSDFLAKADIDKIADPGQKPKAPPQKDEQTHE
jgi:hypothetical protein